MARNRSFKPFCVTHTKKMPAAYLTSKKPVFMRVQGTSKNPKQKYCKKDASF